MNALRDFVARRTEPARPVFGDLLDGFTEDQAATLASILGELRGQLPAELIEEFERWRRERVDTEFLKTFGRVWERGGGGDVEGADGVVLLPAVEERLTEIRTALDKDRALRVLVGERARARRTDAPARAAAQREGGRF